MLLAALPGKGKLSQTAALENYFSTHLPMADWGATKHITSLASSFHKRNCNEASLMLPCGVSTARPTLLAIVIIFVAIQRVE